MAHSLLKEAAARLGLSGSVCSFCKNNAAKLDFSQAALQPLARTLRLAAIVPLAADSVGQALLTLALSRALNRLNCSSMGIVMQPSEGLDGDVHLTGDFYAVAAAQNLLAAVLDNACFWGRPASFDPSSIKIKRIAPLLYNEPALHTVAAGWGGAKAGPLSKTGFIGLAQSETAAVWQRSLGLGALKAGLAALHAADSSDGRPLYAASFNMQGAMAVLLKEARLPNLAADEQGFAFLYHGLTEVSAEALYAAGFLADTAIVETGGSLGFLKPDLCIIDICLTALKGGEQQDVLAVSHAMAALGEHAALLARGAQVVAAIRQEARSFAAEIELARGFCRHLGLPYAIYTEGSEPAALAQLVKELLA